LTVGRSPAAKPSLRRTTKKENDMTVTLSLGPLLALVAGVLILVVPRLLNYIVAVYLIIIGLIGLLGAGNLRL
jgi:DUF3096 family protein